LGIEGNAVAVLIPFEKTARSWQEAAYMKAKVGLVRFQVVSVYLQAPLLTSPLNFQ